MRKNIAVFYIRFFFRDRVAMVGDWSVRHWYKTTTAMIFISRPLLLPTSFSYRSISFMAGSGIG